MRALILRTSCRHTTVRTVTSTLVACIGLDSLCSRMATFACCCVSALSLRCPATPIEGQAWDGTATPPERSLGSSINQGPTMSTATQTSTGQQPPHSAGSRPGSVAGIDQTLWFWPRHTSGGRRGPAHRDRPAGTLWGVVAVGAWYAFVTVVGERSHGRRDGPPNSRRRVQS